MAEDNPSLPPLSRDLSLRQSQRWNQNATMGERGGPVPSCTTCSDQKRNLPPNRTGRLADRRRLACPHTRHEARIECAMREMAFVMSASFPPLSPRRPSFAL